MKLLKKSLLATALLIGVCNVAQAAMVTFNLNYSGAPFTNGASATGSITFDSAINDGTPGQYFSPFTEISALTLTVTGASSGNGTFSLSDYGLIGFADISVLNLTQDLVGQLGFDDLLLGSIGAAPNSFDTFAVFTAGGQAMALTSMTPAASVPESPALLMTLLGLAGLGLAKKRRVA